MKSKIDRIAGRIAKRGLTRDASPLERRVAKALKIAARAKDEEVWRTSEETGKHFQIETETGTITKGFGGKLNGVKVGSKSSGKQGSSWQLERHNRKNAEKGKTEPLNVSGYYANGAEMSSLEEYNQHRRATQPQWEGSASSAGGGGRGSSSNWMKQLYNEVYNSAPTEKTGGVQFRPSPQTLKRLGIEPAKGGLAEQPNRTPSISVNSEQYASTAQKYKEKAAKNPNNLMYKDEAENYKQLAERAKKFDGSKTSHSGVDAVLALGAVKKGGKVRISGIGSWADGEYTKTTWSAPGYTSGEVFKRDKDGRSFGANTGTIMSELGQIRGGKLKENGDVKVDLL